MNPLKKSIAFLTALSFMPLPKAAAEEWSYGIKIGGANSFMKNTEAVNKACEEGIKDHFQKAGNLKPNVKCYSRLWNPSFGAALYMECALNDHIGLGMEVLYSRFEGVWQCKGDMPDSPDISEAKKVYIMEELRKCSKGSTLTTIRTIGLPLFLVWNWTALVRPDFKKDYFHGRIFMGVHPLWCMSHLEAKDEDGGKVKEADVPFNKNHPRYKFGLIYGTSFELPSGWLLELKGMAPYNLLSGEDKKWRPNIQAFHLSVGYNFAKLYA